MNSPIVQIALWSIWTFVLLGGVVSGVRRYRDSSAAREQDGSERSEG
jgi:hypothetical protein